jgi:hypothetical protein
MARCPQLGQIFIAGTSSKYASSCVATLLFGLGSLRACRGRTAGAWPSSPGRPAFVLAAAAFEPQLRLVAKCFCPESFRPCGSPASEPWRRDVRDRAAGGAPGSAGGLSPGNRWRSGRAGRHLTAFSNACRCLRQNLKIAGCLRPKRDVRRPGIREDDAGGQARERSAPASATT